MSDKTNEAIVAEAMVDAGAPLMHSRVEEAVVAALTAEGRLAGEPTDEKVGWPRRNDYFDPPLSNEQMDQVQTCINDALAAAGVAPQSPIDGLRIDDDGLHIYWFDPVEGCWVAFKRADCVSEEELPTRTLTALPVYDAANRLVGEKAEVCGAPANGGACILPRAHNMGKLDVPSNHSSVTLEPTYEQLVTTRDNAEAKAWITSKDDVAAEIAGLRAVANLAAGVAPQAPPIDPESLEIVNGWLVQLGEYEPDPLINLSTVDGWPAPPVYDEAKLAEVIRVARLGAYGLRQESHDHYIARAVIAHLTEGSGS